MTKKTYSRVSRDRRGLPPLNMIAGAHVDHSSELIAFVTKDILKNQLKRDSRKIERSFDKYAPQVLEHSSEFLANSYLKLLVHLKRVDSSDSRATCARLLSTACNSYVASADLARRGYRLQYATMSRQVYEVLATVLVICTEATALEDFHEGKLKSTKCISKAKRIMPGLGEMWGYLSNEFVHIGGIHASLEMPKTYSKDDEALPFICDSLKATSLLLHIISELVFAEECSEWDYWKPEGGGWVFAPSPKGQARLNLL